MKEFNRAKRHIEVSPGESVRILRELQELSQNELADLCGIPQSTISAIENDRVQLGVERAKVLARALKCHPAVLLFPGWMSRLNQRHSKSLQRPPGGICRASSSGLYFCEQQARQMPGAAELRRYAAKLHM